jgi:cell division protein FtsZ
MGIKQLENERNAQSRNVKDDEELKEILESKRTQIKVVGCGGAGNNTITRLNQIGIVGAETIIMNTDAQDLLYNDADKKILLGKELTSGLGAGADPVVGMEAAKESKEEIKRALQGADLVFLTCGLGGGTGTGSIPVVAAEAKKLGALTIAVVTLPFNMEGKSRMKNARMGFENLQSVVDSLIVIPNNRLLEVVPDVSLQTAFKVCDEILVNAVKGITELVTKPGLVNLDFADVRAVMQNSGIAMIGMGESDTENRAFEAVEKALNNPLLSVDIDNATGALVNVVGGEDISIRESQQIVETISKRLDPDAKIIWGAAVDKSMGDNIRAMLVVTGVKQAKVFPDDAKMTKSEKRDMEKLLGVEFME